MKNGKDRRRVSHPRPDAVGLRDARARRRRADKVADHRPWRGPAVEGRPRAERSKSGSSRKQEPRFDGTRGTGRKRLRQSRSARLLSARAETAGATHTPQGSGSPFSPKSYLASEDFRCSLAASRRPISRRASETSRHGFLPVRNGHDGQVIATHLRTSSDEPAQSRHFARIASTGDIGA